MAVADVEFAADGAGVGETLEAEAGLLLGAGEDVVVDPDGVVWVRGLGASTPAVLEPRPSFCRLGASSLPLAFMPLSD